MTLVVFRYCGDFLSLKVAKGFVDWFSCWMRALNTSHVPLLAIIAIHHLFKSPLSVQYFMLIHFRIQFEIQFQCYLFLKPDVAPSYVRLTAPTRSNQKNDVNAPVAAFYSSTAAGFNSSTTAGFNSSTGGSMLGLTALQRLGLTALQRLGLTALQEALCWV